MEVVKLKSLEPYTIAMYQQQTLDQEAIYLSNCIFGSITDIFFTTFLVELTDSY